MSDNDLIRRGEVRELLQQCGLMGNHPSDPLAVMFNEIPAVQPTVKPLVWAGSESELISRSMLGSFSISAWHGKVRAHGPSKYYGEYPTIEAAKAAAQADYEARILSALTTGKEVMPNDDGNSNARPATSPGVTAGAVSPDVAALLDALGYYADQYCEGFCQDFPSASYTDEKCELDCGGCKARATIARVKSKEGFSDEKGVV